MGYVAAAPSARLAGEAKATAPMARPAGGVEVTAPMTGPACEGGVAAPTARLVGGAEMPRSGFGVYGIADDDACAQAVADAIAAGYRLIDTASAYGNERAVGEGIRRAGIPREELFVTTKLWVQDSGYSATHAAFKASLARLGLDYLDLYLIHRPLGDYHGSWRALTELRRAGLVRAIGVCNFDEVRLADLCLWASEAPQVDQVEVNPFCQQTALLGVMREFGVQPEAWAPLAEGRCGIFQNPVLTGIAQRHGKTAAQVALRWNAQRGAVVLSKSVRPECIRENLDIWDFELTAEEMDAIAALDRGVSVLGPETAAGVRARYAFRAHE